MLLPISLNSHIVQGIIFLHSFWQMDGKSCSFGAASATRRAEKSKTMSRSATYAIITFSFRLRTFTFETEVFHIFSRCFCCCSCPISMINELWTLVRQSFSVSHSLPSNGDRLQKKVDVDGKYVWLGFQECSIHRVKWKDCTRSVGDSVDDKSK